jgi:hypothetical protein
VLPSAHSLVLAWLPGLGLPRFLLLICPFQAAPTNHTYKFPYSYHMRPKYTYTTFCTLHIHTCELWFLSSFSLAVTRQAGWITRGYRQLSCKFCYRVRGYEQLPGKSFRGHLRLLAIRQIPQRLLATLKIAHIFQIVLP